MLLLSTPDSTWEITLVSNGLNGRRSHLMRFINQALMTSFVYFDNVVQTPITNVNKNVKV